MRYPWSTFLKVIGPTLLTAIFVLLPMFVQAEPQGTITPGTPQGTYTPTNPQGTYTGTNKLVNPLGVDSFCQLIGVILKAAIAIGIPIAVLFIVWAGFKFILARGSPGELSEARSNFINVIIGIAIFLGASLIAQVIIATLHQLGVNGINSC